MARRLLLAACIVMGVGGCDLFPQTPPDAQLAGGAGGAGGAGAIGGAGGFAGAGGGGNAGTGGDAGLGGTGGDAGAGGGGSGEAGSAGDGGAAGEPITAHIEVGLDDVNEDGPHFESGELTIWIGTGSDPSKSFTGLRFASVDVPPNASVIEASLEFYAPSSQAQSIEILVAAETSANCKLFSPGQPPSKRPTTAPEPIDDLQPWTQQQYNSISIPKT